MKAVPPLTRESKHPDSIPSVFSDRFAVVAARDWEAIAAIADEELVESAYLQAVALYDSCIYHAMANSRVFNAKHGAQTNERGA